jgi:UDP-N-acetylmuramate dehydrogenase
MNAGAYGGEMKDVVIATTAFCPKMGCFEISGAEHDFAYRHSRFSDGKEIALSTVLRLVHGEGQSIKARMDELCAKRRSSQPLDMPSAGSTFKRPKDGYAGTMIEQAGLKGYMSGGAQVSEKHAGFIINKGGATCLDIMRVIEHVREVVFKQYGVRLELEVKVIS